MIISNDFIFFHNPKTGGNTVNSLFYKNQHKLALSGKHPGVNAFKAAGCKVEIRHGHPFVDGVLFWHMSLAFVAKRIDLSGKFVFTFVRNPYTHFYSLYCETHKPGVDFDSWCKVKASANMSQKKYTHLNGKLHVDFVGKTETLNADLERICKVINVDYNRKEDRRRRNNIPCYTQEQARAIEKSYGDDFEVFGYSRDYSQWLDADERR